MGKLQTEETSAQRTRRSSSVAHLAGDVAPARDQPRPHRRGPAGKVRHAHQAHPGGKRQRWIQWHHRGHTAATEAAHGAVSVLTEANNTTHTHTHTLIHTDKWTDLGHLDLHRSACSIIKESPQQITAAAASVNEHGAVVNDGTWSIIITTRPPGQNKELH